MQFDCNNGVERLDRTPQCGCSTSPPSYNVKEAFSRAGSVIILAMEISRISGCMDIGSTMVGTSCCP